MEDKIKELYGILNDSKDFRGIFNSPEALSQMLSDDKKVDEFYNIMNESEEFKGIFKDSDTFKTTFGIKKKNISQTDALEKYLPFLGQSGKNFTNPQSSSTQPLQSTSSNPVQEPSKTEQATPVSYEDSLPENITPTSIIKAASNKQSFMKQRSNDFVAATQKGFDEDKKKLDAEYVKKASAEGADKKQLEAEYESKVNDLLSKRQQEAEKGITDLYGDQNYDNIEKGDVANIEKSITDILATKKTFQERSKAINDFKSQFLSKITELFPDKAKPIERELNDIIAKKTLVDNKGNITVFGWKQEAAQKLKEIDQAGDKVLSDFKTKYPDFYERMTPTPSGPVWQIFSPSVDKDPKRRREFYTDEGIYKRDLTLLGIAQEKLGNVLKLPDDNKAGFTTAFKAGGMDLIASISSAGWSDVAKALENSSIAIKKQNGEKLSVGEQAAFDAKNIFDVAYNNLEGGKLGKAMAQAIPYMESFATLGMSGLGEGVANATLKKLMAQQGAKLISKQGAKTIVKEFGKVAITAATAAPLSPISYTRQQQGIQGAAQLNKQGEWDIDKSSVEGWLEATTKGMATGATEYATESLGGLFGEAGGGLKKIMNAVGVKNFKIPKAFTDVAKTVKMNDIKSEVIEGLVNIPLQAPIGDQPLSDITLQDLWDTVWTTAGMTAILGSAALPTTALDIVRKKNHMNLQTLFGKDSIAQVRDAIENNDKEAYYTAIRNAFKDKTEADMEKYMPQLNSYAKDLATERILLSNKRIPKADKAVVEQKPEVTPTETIAIGNKEEVTRAEKNMKFIKGRITTAENLFKLPIKEGDNEVGNAILDNTPEGWRIKWITVEGTHTKVTQRKGSGREAMRLINQEANKEGKVLISDFVGSQSDAMKSAWGKLVASGEAEQYADGSWGFKKPDMADKGIGSSEVNNPNNPEGVKVNSGLFNKGQVIDMMLAEYPQEVRDEVRSSFAREDMDKFNKMATQAGFNSLGGGQWTLGTVAKIPEATQSKESSLQDNNIKPQDNAKGNRTENNQVAEKGASEPKQGSNDVGNVRNNEQTGATQGQKEEIGNSIENMNGEQLRQLAKDEKTRLRNQEEKFFGKEGAEKYRKAQAISESMTATSEQRKEANRITTEMENSLPKEQYDAFFGLGDNAQLDPSELRDIARSVESIEGAETIDEIASTLKTPLLEFKGDGNDKSSITIFNAVKRKAKELGIDPKELFQSAIKKISKDLPDVEDAKFLASNIFEKILKEPTPSGTADKALLSGNEPITAESSQKTTKTAPITTDGSNTSTAPSKPVNQSENKEGSNEKRTGFEVRKENGEVRGSIELGKSKDEVGKAVGELIDKNPHFYKEYHREEVINDAKAFIEDKGIDGAYADLIGKTKDIDDLDVRHVARQLLMQYFGNELVEAQKTGDKANIEAIADKIVNIEYRTQLELRGGMRMGAFTMWSLLDPKASVFMVERMINEANSTKLGFEAEEAQGFVKEWETEVPDLVKKLLTENEDFKSAIDKLEARVKFLEANKGNNAPRRVTKEKAKEMADKVRALKSTNWGLNFADATGAVAILDGALEITAKTIETTGNVLQAIGDGIKYIKATSWYKGLTTEEKKKEENKYISDIKKQFEDFDTAEYIENSSWFKKDTKPELTEEQKQKKADKAEYNKNKREQDERFRDQIYDVIASHFLVDKGTKESLSDKLQNELGLSSSEAGKIAGIVLKSFEEGAKKVFEKTLAPKIANKGKRETSFDKFFGLIKKGVLNSDNYYESFVTEYKLRKNLTPDEKQQLVRLGINAQNFAPYGLFGDIASNELMQYLTKLTEADNWLTRNTKLMIAFDYARMLSGYTTHFVNLKSSGINIGVFSWVGTVANLGRWADTAAAYLKGDKVKARMINPIADLYYQPSSYQIGAKIGVNEATNIVKHGNIKQASKYLESVGNAKGSNVPVLERDTFGKGKAFKPIVFKKTFPFIGRGDATVDMNILNKSKYVGRTLLAEDTFMTNIPFAHQLALAARRMEIQKGTTLSESALRNKILNEINGTHLTETQFKEVEQQLKDQVQALKDAGYEPDANQIKQRRFEITRSMLDLEPDVIEEASQIAKGDVFNDRRGGIFSVIGDGAASIFNKNLAFKVLSMSKMPFTGVLGRIGDFTLDTIYGGLRARGWSPTGIIARARMYHQTGNFSDFMKAPMDFDMFKSAQMGIVGSPRYYQQMNRQYIGMFTLMAGAAALLKYDKDDDDPFLDITGELPFTDLQGRSKHPMGQYALKIGKWKLKYNNYPIIAMPLAILGNYKDHIKAGVTDEEFGAKFSLAVHAMNHSIGLLKDTNIAKGLGDLVTLIQDALAMFDTKKERETLKDTGTGLEDEEMLGSQFEKSMKELGQSYIDLPLRAIFPSKSNLVQQIWKGVTPEGRLKGTGVQLLAYNLGLQNIANDKRTDIFGNTIKTLPGEQGIAWPRQEDARWDKLWKYNVSLTDISEKDMKVIRGIKRTFEWDEYLKRKQVANALFTERFDNYFKNLSEAKLKEKRDTYESAGSGKYKTKRTLVDIEINDIWTKTKEDVDRYLFTWDKQVKQEPKLMNLLYKEGLLPKFDNKKMVLDGDRLVYASDSKTPKEKQIIVPFDVLEKINEKAMEYFIKNTRYLLGKDLTKLHTINEDTNKSTLQEDVEKEWSNSLQDARDKIGTDFMKKMKK